ncbi:hypothetical protein GOBAR_AA10389 [Gossypium barbadense]|uniref:Leucine-rich repeat-containing N-terminal plant-type domain-containing protein n=1 Tax=Gossypium barbadense TaxID=3634 RepID=A0A2P5Y3Q1_GOSBA|nr:hypothetical protein GOBAR_AA10389 [Gossypium barbadense]
MTTPLLISLFPFLLLIPALCFSICHANSNVLCIQSEREALLKFKNHLIDPSNKLSSWVERGDCCKWIGVVCHNSTGHVHQLHLAAPSPFDFAEWDAYRQSKLEGKINPSLLELKHLSSLDLSNNNFSSIHIPKFFGLLESLTYLKLSQAQFHGAISHNLGNLSKLQYLDLGGNNLKSKSLQWVSGLSFLQYLDLSSADLHKANDWVQVTFKLPSLLELYLSDCGLEDVPSSISVNSSKSLVILDLSGNSLSSVPKWIFSLHGLVSIDLSDSSLEGPIPDYFGNISILEVLDLTGNSLNSSIPNFFDNQLQGTISSAIGNLSSVTYLDLSENQLNGQIPLSIGQLSSLELFDVSENQLNGQIPLSIGELSSLELFDVSENQLNGTFPLSIGELSSLKYLDFGKWMVVLYIDKNLISGNIPDCWNHWQGLDLLNLGSNNLTGKISPSLWHLNLTMLNLRNNRMFGELPSTLQNSLHLVMLDLSENHFSGSIPAWIGDKLSNLAILSLRSNNFDGHIPHKICDLQFLQNLDLAHNNISRVIPKCFNNLSAMATTNKTNNFVFATFVVADFFFLNALLVLKGREDEYGSTLGLVTSMDLSANSLTGEIPKEIGSLVGLLSLNFSGNLLIGNIPESIGNMELMESLDLSMNRLNGEIPPSFSNLNFLNHFNVSYNNLTGQIPTSTQLQSFDNLSYMGNHLCGPPLTKNCTAKGIPTDIANNGSSSEGRKVNSPYVSLALGFVMGFWGVVAPLFFIRSWRIAYYRKLDHIYVYCFSHNVSSSSLDVGVVPYGGSDIEVEVGAWRRDGPIAQRIRARVYKPRCRGFKSLLAHNQPKREGPFPLGGNCGLLGESMTVSLRRLLVLVHLRTLNWLVLKNPRTMEQRITPDTYNELSLVYVFGVVSHGNCNHDYSSSYFLIPFSSSHSRFLFYHLSCQFRRALHSKLSSWVEGGVAVNGLVSSAITQQATSTNCTWLLFQSLMTLHHMLIMNGKLLEIGQPCCCYILWLKCMQLDDMLQHICLL